MKVLIDIPQEVLEKPHDYCCYTLANQIKGNYTPIPDNTTNGNIIKALFPKIDDNFSNIIDLRLWWNAPYKRGSENE